MQVLDECHHTHSDHPYNVILGYYRRRTLEEQQSMQVMSAYLSSYFMIQLHLMWLYSCHHCNALLKSRLQSLIRQANSTPSFQGTNLAAILGGLQVHCKRQNSATLSYWGLLKQMLFSRLLRILRNPCTFCQGTHVLPVFMTPSGAP